MLDNSGNSYTYLAFEEGNIRQRLEAMLGIPVFMDNDSSVMAMAEHTFGAARESMHALCISVNECIGMGMILNGHPLYGLQGMAGEFGHVRVTEEDILCYCGKTGCRRRWLRGARLSRLPAKPLKSGKATTISCPSEEITLDKIVEAATHDDIFCD